MSDSKRVPTLVLAGIFAASACAEDPEDAARPGLSLLGQDTNSIVTGSEVESMNGTYTNCTNRSGSWSLAITGSPTLDNSALSVIKGDTACTLAITDIRTGPDGLLAASSPLVLGTNFGTPVAFGSPVKFYANAVLGSVNFSTNFVLTMLFSTDPTTATGSNTASFATVNASSASATGVAAPNYTLDLSGVGITTDILGVAAGVTGNVVLTAGSATGDFYVIVNGAVADTYAAINTAYTARTPIAMATSIAASSFVSGAVNLTGGVVRSLIIAKVTNGVASYQKFAITFSPPV